MIVCDTIYPDHIGGGEKWNWEVARRLSVDAITSFSATPLRWITGLGALISLIGVIFALRIMWDHFVRPAALAPGWASIMALVLFLGGVQLVCLGMIGQYIGRIFEESKKRPLYFLKQDVSVPICSERQNQA